MRSLISVLMMILMLGLASQNALAQPGMGPGTGPGNWHDNDTMPDPHPGTGMGPDQEHPWGDQSYILEGEPFNHSGHVVQVEYRAGGMVMAAPEGNIHLYGMGPTWYWESHDMDWPRVGDSMEAEGYMVDYHGVRTNIVMSVTMANGRRLQLRDPDTGWPLWMN